MTAIARTTHGTTHGALPIPLLIDTFPFNGEPIVQLRLQLMAPLVDLIYVVEARYTHSGKRKASLYTHLKRAWFEPYMDKVRFLILDEFSEMSDARRREMQQLHPQTPDPTMWHREHEQRDLVQRELVKLDQAKQPYVILVCDCDELVCPQTLKQIRMHMTRSPIGDDHNTLSPIQHLGPVGHLSEQIKQSQHGALFLKMDFYYYNWQWRKSYQWTYAYVTDHCPESLSKLRLYGYQVQGPQNYLASLDANSVSWSAASVFSPQSNIQGQSQSHLGQNNPLHGWHLSYFFDKPGLVRKMESLAHGEHNKAENKTKRHLDLCLGAGIDILKRNHQQEQLHRANNLLPVALVNRSHVCNPLHEGTHLYTLFRAKLPTWRTSFYYSDTHSKDSESEWVTQSQQVAKQVAEQVAEHESKDQEDDAETNSDEEGDDDEDDDSSTAEDSDDEAKAMAKPADSKRIALSVAQESGQTSSQTRAQSKPVTKAQTTPAVRIAPFHHHLPLICDQLIALAWSIWRAKQTHRPWILLDAALLDVDDQLVDPFGPVPLPLANEHDSSSFATQHRTRIRGMLHSMAQILDLDATVHGLMSRYPYDASLPSAILDRTSERVFAIELQGMAEGQAKPDQGQAVTGVAAGLGFSDLSMELKEAWYGNPESRLVDVQSLVSEWLGPPEPIRRLQLSKGIDFNRLLGLDPCPNQVKSLALIMQIQGLLPTACRRNNESNEEAKEQEDSSSFSPPCFVPVLVSEQLGHSTSWSASDLLDHTFHLSEAPQYSLEFGPDESASALFLKSVLGSLVFSLKVDAAIDAHWQWIQEEMKQRQVTQIWVLYDEGPEMAEGLAELAEENKATAVIDPDDDIYADLVPVTDPDLFEPCPPGVAMYLIGAPVSRIRSKYDPLGLVLDRNAYSVDHDNVGNDAGYDRGNVWRKENWYELYELAIVMRLCRAKLMTRLVFNKDTSNAFMRILDAL